MAIGNLLTWKHCLLLMPLILPNNPVLSLKCDPFPKLVFCLIFFPTFHSTNHLGFLNHFLFCLQQKHPSTVMGWVQLHHTAHLYTYVHTLYNIQTQRTALFALKHGGWSLGCILCFQRAYSDGAVIWRNWDMHLFMPKWYCNCMRPTV